MPKSQDKDMVAYRESCTQCQSLRQEISALKQQKPQFKFEWRTVSGTSGLAVTLVFSISMFLLTMFFTAVITNAPDGHFPAIHHILIAWPGIPFIVMLHLIRIVKR